MPGWHTIVDTIVEIDDDWSMRYPGGKGTCYQHLINLMPRHETYIESHLGGGAVLRHKRPAARNIGVEVDASVLQRIRPELPDGTESIHADAVAFLKDFSYTGHELVYSDPPYLLSTRRGGKIYRHEYAIADHEALLDVLSALPCMVMVSGYDNALYTDRLKGWRKHTFRAKTHTDVREETVWMNYPEPAVLHDSRFVGDTFRERQGVQRRRETLRKRLTDLPSHERAAIIQWMSSTFHDEFREALCR